MRRNRKFLIAGGAALVLAGGAVGIAQAVGGEDESVKGPEADRAAAAAVKAVGGGTASEVERDDSAQGWEVEVKRPDGSQVEVHLTDSLQTRGTQADDDGSGQTGEHEGDNED